MVRVVGKIGTLHCNDLDGVDKSMIRLLWFNGKWAVRHPKIVPGTSPTISKPANHSTPSKCQCGVVPGASRYMYMRSGTVLHYLL